MASNTIKIILAGDAKGLVNSLETASSRVSKFGVAATAALGAFGVMSVKAFHESEMAQERLNFALSKSATLAGVTAESLRGYNEVLAEKTAIDDDVIAGAEAVLARFATTEEQLKELTALTADYSRVTGQDMVTSATAVGKALLGNTRALKALGINYTLTGDAAKDAANIQELLNEKVGGYAEEYAATAAGKSAELARQYGELQESIGAVLLPMLEKLVDVLTPVLKAFDSLPDWAKQATFFLALFGAAAMAVVPRLLNMRAALVANGVTLGKVTAATKKATAELGPLGGGWKGAAKGAALLTAAMAAQAAGSEDLWAKQMDVNQAIQEVGAPGVGDKISNALAGITDAVFEHATTLDDAKASLAAYDTQMADLVNNGHTAQAAKLWADAQARADELGISADELNGLFPEYTEALGGSTDAQTTFNQVADDTAKKLDTLIDKFTILRRGFLDQREATRGYEAALDDAEAALKENGKTLNKHTAAGRANQEALDGVATAADEVTKSNLQAVKSGKMSADEAMAAYRQQRADLEELARSFGMTKKEADKYVDSILRAPKEVRTDLKAIGDKAEVLAWQRLLQKTPETIITHLGAVVTYSPGGTKGQRAHAEGGYISGPGGPTEDAIPAWLSNGEYVVRAAAVRKLGVGFLNMLNQGKVGRFAAGGPVGSGAAQEQIRTYNSAVMDKLNELVQAAKDQLKELKAQRKDYAQGVASGLTSSLTLGGAVREDGDNDANSLLKRYKQRARQMKSFIGQLNRLYKAGLSRALLAEVMDMGIDEGSTMARVLLADKTLIKQFNRVSSGADNAAARFGRTMGNRYYGGRIDRAEKELDRAEAKRARARQDIKRDVVVNVNIAGSVMTDKELARVLTPTIKEQLHKHDRKNGH